MDRIGFFKDHLKWFVCWFVPWCGNAGIIKLSDIRAFRFLWQICIASAWRGPNPTSHHRDVCLPWPNTLYCSLMSLRWPGNAPDWQRAYYQSVFPSCYKSSHCPSFLREMLSHTGQMYSFHGKKTKECIWKVWCHEPTMPLWHRDLSVTHAQASLWTLFLVMRGFLLRVQSC